jgi:hypothetical protein
MKPTFSFNNSMKSRCTSSAWLLIVLLLVPLYTSAAGLPEKLRILSVDLGAINSQEMGKAGSAFNQELQKLLEKADPDIVCLQGATDWETCDNICKLKQGLRVITCSAFSSKPDNTVTPPQVAILARDRAVLSWVDEISEGQSFAFGILQTGTRKLGIFSLQSPKTASMSGVAGTDRILAEVRKLQQFPQNRPDAFLVATSGALKTTAFLENAFQTVHSDGPPGLDSNHAEFWTWNASFLSRPRLVPIPGITTPALVCDLDTANSSPSKFAYQSTLLFAGESAASVQALITPPPPVAAKTWNVYIMSALGGALVLGLILLFTRRTVKPITALVSLNSPEGLVLNGPPVEQQVKTNLIAWIKTRFMQRLLSDRQQMIATENEATRRTLVIEEKISHLQSALQSRISAYETRIDRLEQELTAATFENRDLIRNQIQMLKEKVAKAKEEHTFRRN